MKPRSLVLAFFGLVFATAPGLVAQGEQGRVKLPDDPRERRKLVLERFDADKDGRLNSAERSKALAWLKKHRPARPRGERGGPPPGGPGGRGGFPGGGRGRGGPRTRPLVEQFDADKSGFLDAQERVKAREAAKSGGRRRGRRRGRGRGGEDSEAPIQPHRVEKDAVATYPKKRLYDPGTLRTVFLDFPQSDWLEELSDFYRTDVKVPATLTVDGKVYANVGVKARGNSSFFGVGGKKKSFNVYVDDRDDKQRLRGYKTLKLLNSHADPSFLREGMFLRICRDYIPASQSNHVKLVVNGESWGIYVNVQQYNKDFLSQAFGTKEGVRWKVPAGGGGSLAWNDDPSAFERSFELKTADAKGALDRLMNLSRLLDRTPDDEIEETLRSILDIDETLWFLALDHVLMDGDGYVSRGSDYYLYEDENGRFHFIPHDSNESFRTGGGGPGSRNYPRGIELSPLLFAEDRDRPVIRRLLGVPHLRARYLAHVRTIVDEWLDWKNVLGPLAKKQHELIASEIKRDDKALYGYRAFSTSVEGGEGSGGGGRRRTPPLREFVESRREYLLGLECLKGAWPTIKDAGIQARRTAAGGVLVAQVAVGKDVAVEKVVLWHAPSKKLPYTAVTLHDDGRHQDGAAGDGVFGGMIRGPRLGDRLYWYAEARTSEEIGRAAFWPRKAEAKPKRLKLN
ncbi:MAG: hypothetical protein CMJ83_03960 [Planctomycetes bacterium]|nr:hypothetical protein [Planctomycetota bacterium]